MWHSSLSTCHIRWAVHTMKVAIMQFTPVSSYTMSLRSKCGLYFKLIFACTHGISKMLGQPAGVSSPRQNKEKSSDKYTSANIFRGIAPTFTRLQSFKFLFMGTLEKPSIQILANIIPLRLCNSKNVPIFSHTA